MKKKKKKPQNINETICTLVTWLNGRLTSPIVVSHKGSSHVVWDLLDGQDGTTIEDAVQRFIEKHEIDWEAEVSPRRPCKKGLNHGDGHGCSRLEAIGCAGYCTQHFKEHKAEVAYMRRKWSWRRNGEKT